MSTLYFFLLQILLYSFTKALPVESSVKSVSSPARFCPDGIEDSSYTNGKFEETTTTYILMDKSKEEKLEKIIEPNKTDNEEEKDFSTQVSSNNTDDTVNISQDKTTTNIPYVDKEDSEKDKINEESTGNLTESENVVNSLKNVSNATTSTVVPNGKIYERARIYNNNNNYFNERNHTIDNESQHGSSNTFDLTVESTRKIRDTSSQESFFNKSSSADPNVSSSTKRLVIIEEMDGEDDDSDFVDSDTFFDDSPDYPLSGSRIVYQRKIENHDYTDNINNREIMKLIKIKSILDKTSQRQIKGNSSKDYSMIVEEKNK